MTFLLNILANLASSLLFLFIVLWLLKPTIKIAPFICKCQSMYPDEGIMYFIKVVNKSYFSAYEVKAELVLVHRIVVPPNGSINRRFTQLKFKRGEALYIPNFLPRWIRKEARHAMIFRTAEDLDTLLKDVNNSVQVQLTLKHGLTGLTKLYTFEYCDPSEIKEGKFRQGTKFAVM